MLSEISKTNEEKEEKIQEEINSYIDASESLVFKSGAGAGKTYALVESLKYIINNYNTSLSKHNQKILCITYTNVAADEMRERLGASELVKISTIHERIWDIIKRHKLQLVEIHEERLRNEISMLEQKLNNDNDCKVYQDLNAKEKDSFQKIMLSQKDKYYEVYNANAKGVEQVFNPILNNFQEILKNKGNFRKIVNTIYKISKYSDCLNKIDSKQRGYQKVIYKSNYNSDKLDKMQISHDTVLEYGLTLIQNYDLVKQIIIDQYPYILIDEYQDTNRNVVEIMKGLNEYSNKIKRKFFIGYFGDPVQNIYEDGVGTQLEKIHSGLKIVRKKFNRRSYEEVINVTNKIRMDDINQDSIYDDAVGGSVKFYYGSPEDVDTFIENHIKDWDCNKDNPLNSFFLTHKTAAQYSGFGNIYEHFRKTKRYKVNYNQLTTELLSDDPVKLGGAARVFYNLVDLIIKLKSGNTPLLEFYGDKQFYEKLTFEELSEVINLLKLIDGTTIKDYINSIHTIYEDNNNTQLRKILNDTIGLEEITLESFHDYLLKELYPNIEDDKIEEANESISGLLEIDLQNYENWYKYIQGNIEKQDENNYINYHTYHSTKGLEFDNILIIMADNFSKQKDFFKFYFQSYKNIESFGDDDMTKFEKAKNLLYVACSRAVKNLSILYLGDVSEIEENIAEIFGEPMKFGRAKETVHS